MTVRESDIIEVDDSFDHSSDGDAPIIGLNNDSTSQASLENHMPPPSNQPSRLANVVQTFLDSCEHILGVSLAQPPLDRQVLSNCTTSAPAVSHPVDPAIFAPVLSPAPAPEDHQPATGPNSETGLSGKKGMPEGSGKVGKPGASGNVEKPAVSGKVDYGPMREFWLRYSDVKGLEKKKNSQSATSSHESNRRASHEGTGVNVHGPHDKSGGHPGTELAPPVQSVGDAVVQGSVVAGEVGAPPDVMGVVTLPLVPEMLLL